MRHREKTELRDGMLLDRDMPHVMDDGVVLRCDIYRPPAEGRYPANAATAEISRSQVWQGVHNGVVTGERTPVTPERVRRIPAAEPEKIRAAVREGAFAAGRHVEADEPFEGVALADDFVEFLTLPAYERLD